MEIPLYRQQNKFRLLLLVIFSLGVLMVAGVVYSCSSSGQLLSYPPVSYQPILQAKVLSWKDLTKSQRGKVREFNFFYKAGQLKSLDRDTASYLEAVVDIEWLSLLTYPEKDLAQFIVNHQNPFLLYGKNKNKWVFEKNGSIIPETTEFEGFNTIEVKRDLHSTRDTLLIGPIPYKPNTFKIVIRKQKELTAQIKL